MTVQKVYSLSAQVNDYIKIIDEKYLAVTGLDSSSLKIISIDHAKVIKQIKPSGDELDYI